MVDVELEAHDGKMVNIFFRLELLICPFLIKIHHVNTIFGKNVKKFLWFLNRPLQGHFCGFCVKCWIIMIEIYVRFDLLTNKVRQGFPWDFQRIKSQQCYVCSWWSFKCHKLFFSQEHLFVDVLTLLFNIYLSDHLNLVLAIIIRTINS